VRKKLKLLNNLFLIVIFIVIALLPFSQSQGAETDYVIDGDKVYINISGKGMLTQEPHTLTDLTNKPILDFTSYFSEEKCLDFIFLFDTNKAKPTGAEYWTNYSHPNEIPVYGNVTYKKDCLGEYQTNYDYINSTWMWCNYTITNEFNETNETIYWEHYFTAYKKNASGIRIFWNKTEITEYVDNPLWYYDWKDISHKFDFNDTTFLDYTKAYYIKGINFTFNETKTIRPTIKVTPMLGKNSGKYGIIMKFCEDTLQQAYDSDRYVYIDPWWNSDWSYGFPVNYTFVTPSSGYKQVNLTILNGTDIDLGYFNSTGKDFRIFNATSTSDPCNNADTELDYFIESWTSARADLVVNFSSIINNTAQPYCIYAGNDAVATSSNGNTTFRFFDDFSGDLSKWTQAGGGTKAIVNGKLNLSEGGEQQTPRLNSTALSSVDAFTIVSYKIHCNGIDVLLAIGGSPSFVAGSGADCYYGNNPKKAYRDGAYSQIADPNSYYTETDAFIDFIDSTHMNYRDSEGDSDLGRALAQSTLPSFVHVAAWGTNGDASFDDIKVRSYVTSKTASYGAVESAPSVNTAPTITDYATSPSTITPQTNFSLNLTIADTTNATVISYVQFYLNGTANGSVQSTSVTVDTNTLVANLTNSSFSLGSTLIAEYWAGDNEYNSTKANTTSVTVYQQMKGIVKDSNSAVVNNAKVIIINQATNTITGTTDSNSTGGWIYNISSTGTYLVVAYDPNNSTRDGDCDPHIVVS